ncbi:O-antigen ligase family protein [Eudoraea adriatica]|uniref:O-antigen ligase family protein n=1 Tax=Eudoraea adriatica TaxID=446681 RepID=UPI001461437F|nr:O-antigen ligase family protein [Eudoraea adriatica]
MDKNIIEQALAINTYPYEFVLSKAEKHLNVFFETHKVYLSLQFLTAILLSINLIANFKIDIFKKILLGILSFLFVLAIVYSQAITTVLALVIILVLAPFLYFKGRLEKIIFGIGVLSCLTLGWMAGLLDTYKNKNTDSITKLLDYVISPIPMEEGVDKRIYIYDCSINLIKKEILFGYGVGNVQQKLNDCYQEKNYVVTEFRSLGSEINTHNYYFHMWLSAGLFALLFLLYMFGHNFYIALKLKNFTFLFFLLMFSLSLLTENVLVRMYGVFLFAVMNSLFYSNCKIDAGNGE